MLLEIEDIRVVDDSVSKGVTVGFGVHADETIKALKRQGVVVNGNAKIVLHQGPGHLAKRIDGKINVLYTAFEAPDLPDIYVKAAEGMDLIVCVSKFVADAYKRALPKKPLAVCPLGVDINTYDYVKRKATEPFIYLWIGAPSERKGWNLLVDAWRKQLCNDKSCLLVVKTTRSDANVQRSGNVVVDTRKLSREKLAQLYKACHCFVFPSYAEGFGLPLAEAMSTGMPCIYVPWSGVTEYANRRNAIPLRYKIVPVNYGVDTTAAMASVDDLNHKMQLVKRDYGHYVSTIGKNARRTIEKDFSWDDTGKRLRKIIEEFKRYGTINSR